MEDELELDGELDDAPPLALSFFCASLELDDELDGELEGAGALVVPEAELEDEPGVALGELVVPEPDVELEDEPGVVAPEPEGVVALEDDAPLGALEPPLSDLLQPAIIAPPNARETARARVETFIGPPWLGYGVKAARIGPRILRSHPRRLVFRRRRRVRALRPGLVAALLEVAVLVRMLRIDLPLRGIRAFALLGRCRSSSLGRGGRGP
ncbi:MAG TPA: hypothetical protein VNU64_04715 [Burkholderiales bacterium]|nr:hypothetical protein [Burkholderiales bacterium]